MENLHPEIMLDIFTRLPAESVLMCKQVCKKWGALLHNPSFVHMHLQRQLPQFDGHEFDKQSNGVSTKLGLITVAWMRDSEHNQLCYGEYDENDEQSFKKLIKINHPALYGDQKIVGSCNGLICFSVRHHLGFDYPVYICNPITREYVNLPSLNIKAPYGRGHRMVSGFGYHPSTNEYKVVRIYYNNDQPYTGRVQVYTLGGIKVGRSRWRNKLEISHALGKSNELSPGILANGALHWLNDEGKILAFDLEDEEFRLIPLPPCYCRYFSFKLQVLRGCLSLVHEKTVKGVDVWSLKKKKKSSCSYGMKEEEYISWNWSREFSITFGSVELFTLTKSNEVILWYCNNMILARYDPRTGTFERLGKFDVSCSKAQSHINSFVSLKALGEDAKFLKSADRPGAKTKRKSMSEV